MDANAYALKVAPADEVARPGDPKGRVDRQGYGAGNAPSAEPVVAASPAAEVSRRARDRARSSSALAAKEESPRTAACLAAATGAGVRARPEVKQGEVVFRFGEEGHARATACGVWRRTSATR